MDKKEFRFKEKKHVSVITVKQIIEGNKPVLFVSHDTEGYWQFLPGEPVSETDARVITLLAMVEHDPTLNGLFDLPEGWEATRSSVNDKWMRQQTSFYTPK